MKAILKFFGFILLSSIVFYFSTLYVLWVFSRILLIYSQSVYYISGVITGFTAICLIVVRFWASLISQTLYYVISLWWGVLLYTFMFGIVHDIVSAIYPLSMEWGLTIIILPTGGLFLYGLINGSVLKVDRIDVTLPGLENNVRIAQISDLHLGPIYNRSYTEKIVKEIIKENPDFVAITGDLFDGSMKLTADMVEPFNELPMNIYYVLGNHDAIFCSMDEVIRVISRTKIILLRNEQVSYKGVNIIGLDYSAQYGYLANKLSSQCLSDNSVNILLYHVPELKVDKLEEYNVHLHLSGHTHAGQMIPFQFHAWLLYSYLKGLHQSKTGRAYAHVSEGTGTAGTPFRMFSNNTITILNIH